MISLSSLFFQLVYTLMPLIEFQTRDQLDQPTLLGGREGRGGKRGQPKDTEEKGTLCKLLRQEELKNLFNHSVRDAS